MIKTTKIQSHIIDQKTPFFLALSVVVFAPLIEGGTTYLPVFILRLLVLSLLVLFIRERLKQGSFHFHGSPLDIFVALFLMAAVISAFIAPYKYMALTWVQLIFYYILFFYLARWALGKAGSVRPVVFVMLGMGMLEATVGAVQWVSGRERAVGTFFNPNMLAGYLVPALLVSLTFLLFKEARPKGWPSRFGLAVLSALGLFVIIVTGSRGGILALSAGLLVVLWLRFRVWAAVTVSALVLAVLLMPNPVRDRAFGSDPFAYSRANIWWSAARMMVDHPQGVGLGNFKYYWARYNFPVAEAVIKYGKIADTAHGEYLHIGAEMGFAGLAVLLSGLCLLAKALVRSLKATINGKDKAVAAGLVGGVTAVLTHGFVDSNLHEPGIVYLIILLVSLAMNVSGENSERAAVFEVKPEKRTRVAVLSVALIGLLAGWAVMQVLGYHYSELGGKELKSGRPNTALRSFDTAILLEPGNAAHHNLRASALYAIYRTTGRDALFEESIGELDEATGLNPEDYRYHEIKAGLLYDYAIKRADPSARADLLAAAQREIKRAVELNPYGAGILFSEALILQAQGRRGSAAEVLERLKAIEPNYLKARLALAGMYMEGGQNILSRQECYSIIRLNNTFKGRPLAEPEKSFVGIDTVELNRLCGSLEGR